VGRLRRYSPQTAHNQYGAWVDDPQKQGKTDVLPCPARRFPQLAHNDAPWAAKRLKAGAPRLPG